MAVQFLTSSKTEQKYKKVVSLCVKVIISNQIFFVLFCFFWRLKGELPGEYTGRNMDSLRLKSASCRTVLPSQIVSSYLL